ncbi:MAG TPA: maleylpyruvate isomerase N-terminal domain-containing protein, partial [Syntrophales bacterium]|nr:maleylpyruvate isomerase N-terminal domain-containing protein [Syntrophales bacterium]
MTDLIGDLAAEQETLEAVVTALAEAVWDRPTPFYGWTIRDEICHLAFFDAAARLSATDAAA